MANPSVRTLKPLEERALSAASKLDEIVHKQDKIGEDLKACFEMLNQIRLIIQPEKLNTDQVLPETATDIIKENLLFAGEFIKDEHQLDALRTAFMYSHHTKCPSEIPEVVYDAFNIVAAKVQQAHAAYKHAQSAIAHARSAALAHEAAIMVNYL